MTIKKISKIQPEFFEFNEENLKKTQIEISKYPKKRKASAVLPLLYLVQTQNENWIPLIAIKYVAKLLGMPYIKVYEVATFYSMFNLSPVGKYFVQVCTTTPCMIRGAKKITDICKKHISKNENVLSDNIKSILLDTPVGSLSAPVDLPDGGLLFFKIRDKRDVEENLSLEEMKNRLVSSEKTKILNMHSLSHYDKVRRSISIKFYQ